MEKLLRLILCLKTGDFFEGYKYFTYYNQYILISSSSKNVKKMEMGGKKQVLDGSLLVSCESSAALRDLTQTGFPKVAAGRLPIAQGWAGPPQGPTILPHSARRQVSRPQGWAAQYWLSVFQRKTPMDSGQKGSEGNTQNKDGPVGVEGS